MKIFQSLQLSSPAKEVDKITKFIQQTYEQQGFNQAVIGVSGGIDSALSITLLTQALGAKKIFPVFMPYKNQSIKDSQQICQFNHISTENWITINIAQMVDSFADELGISGTDDKIRLGNVMARARMTVLFDLAKQQQALICGTENKSENMLGYFTRCGDEASDLEPIVHLYKTQVRQLAKFLKLPELFIKKPPSAGLWPNQTDEKELGFSYEQADQVLWAMEHEGMENREADLSELELGENEINQEIIDRIKLVVKANQFKRQVPYKPV